METIIVFSGAGLSAESGIPTFRDSNGLWHNHKVEDVATPEGWSRDKELVLNFYNERFKNIKEVSPNDAHRALAELGKKYRVVNVTQNIDDLLERAGCEEVIHLHGSINSRKCEFHRSVNPEMSCYFKEERRGTTDIWETCPVCGGNLRPDVVWFGEPVDMESFKFLELAYDRNTLGIIGVGTSANVQPAASVLLKFSHLKVKHFVDLNPPGGLFGWRLWRGKATEELPKLVKSLL